MGPVTFWSARQYAKYVEKDIKKQFKQYLCQSILTTYYNRKKIYSSKLEDITCVSLKVDDKDFNEIEILILDEEKRYSLIKDAIQILSFSSNITRHGVKEQNITNIHTFNHIYVVSRELLNKPGNWGYTQLLSSNSDKRTKVSSIDTDLSECFGNILAANYLLTNSRWTRRIIQAIRHFNLIFRGEKKQSVFAQIELFYHKPEDIVFLSMAFEALLDLHFGSQDRKNTTKKFVNSVITILNIPYEKLKGKMRAWLEDFYQLRSDVVHGEDISKKEFHTMKAAHVFYKTLINQLQSHACMKPDILREIHSNDYLVRLFLKSDIMEIIKDLLIPINISIKNGRNKEITEEAFTELSDHIMLFNNICIYRKHFSDMPNSYEANNAEVIYKILTRSSRKFGTIKDVLIKKGVQGTHEFTTNLQDTIQKGHKYFS